MLTFETRVLAPVVCTQSKGHTCQHGQLLIHEKLEDGIKATSICQVIN